MLTPQALMKRANKLERQTAFASLLEAIEKQRSAMSPSERRRFLATVMAKTVSGDLTPQQANTLTKAIG